MKTVFITGASSGIGKETAIYFHNKGWNVVATMRKPEQENQLINLKNVTCLYLDVLDEQSIKEAVFVAINSFGKIDVLINNAGYSALGVFESASNDQIKRQFDTNVFGLMNVTREILPHFRENKSGTVVNIASVAGRMGFPLFSLYNGTKWAVEGFSEALYYELKKLGIKVKIIEPGPIKTDFYGRSMDITKKDNLTDYNEIVDNVEDKMIKTGNNGSLPSVVAKKIYKASISTSSRLRYSTGGGAGALIFARRFMPDRLFRSIVGMVMGAK